MRNNRNSNARNLVLLLILSLTLISVAQAQSTDIDNPTALTSNVIEGENEGENETLYYSFTATKGDVKITFDGKTKNYSTWIKVDLLNEDGSSELFSLEGVATSTGKRTVGTKRFLREQKVMLRVSIDKDALMGFVNYKIRLDGAVKLDTPPIAPAEATPAATTETSPAPAATTETSLPAEQAPSTEAQPAADSTAPPVAAPKTATKDKDKLKVKAKKEVKKLLGGILDN